MTGEKSDAALVAAARSGSDAAFSRLVDRHQQALRQFLRRICPSPAEAEDLAQEAFLAAWQKLASLRQPEHFKTWLHSLAWNKARTLARSAARRRVRDTQWQADRPEISAVAADMNLALQQAMAKLPEGQRAVVALCLGGGWSHGDAAKILEMPLGTVKSHASRGRARLAELLGASDE